MTSTDISNYLKEYILINVGTTKHLIKKNNILYLKSKGNYTTIHLENLKEIKLSYNLGNTLNKYFKDLPFIRINQSNVINIDKVSVFKKDEIIFDNQKTIKASISSTYAKALITYFNQSNIL